MRDMGPRDRSIRNIPVPKSHRRPATYEVDHDDREEVYEPRPAQWRGRKTFWIIASIVVVICAAAGLLLSTLFAGATVVVFERRESVEGPITLGATLNPPTGSLGYGIMSGTRSATTTVPASGTKDVSRAASGVITIYNGYSTESQRLIARTRFEAQSGNIYRIQESVDIPGATEEEDGSLTPGRETVTVYADAPGASYNSSGATSYTLPALKGDPRYETMYAEGEAMTGGFEGPEPAIAEEDLARAQTSLQQGLAQAAQSALASQIPAGYLAVPGSLEIVYSDIAQAAGENNTATLSQTATMQAAIVKIDDLANAVAKEKVSGYQGEAVTFVDPAQVITSQSPGQSEGSLTLSLSGNLELLWRYDPGALKSALVGKKKDDFERIIQAFAPAISRAEARIQPFWDGSFPDDPEKIEVVAGVQ
ncbi:hypothetical protein A3F55_01860 [Candidatus Adlerbacteria bacterium RIFCSPHIGHO2_12_FULL_53_18]|uniref:Baseplate protein J-like domain-containing protein n=1 Tax=Candidatus Adlerbacteria bacterium RIFCSPHIGHO2_12_FULL_53_18 TaxID=1797242 RepID=A0A1F4XTW8_9BACT|nr:MAG: hypothetical protein A3F55_01860 [Candidatus Adlerbacteria bacterium RIFCSPHIGHO2_12_FULL_53_18]